jgi:hypothetical protein
MNPSGGLCWSTNGSGNYCLDLTTWQTNVPPFTGTDLHSTTNCSAPPATTNLTKIYLTSTNLP